MRTTDALRWIRSRLARRALRDDGSPACACPTAARARADTLARTSAPAHIDACGRMLALLCVAAWTLCASAPASAQFSYTDGIRKRDAALLQAQIAALAPQRAGTVDLYALGFAGDSTENVFRNEVHYFEDLMRQRFGADGRTLALVNHADSLFVRPRPLATLENLRVALAGIGAAMDADEDVLLLFMTMHGTEDHRLQVQMAPAIKQWLKPENIREALDASGIRNRVVVVSACYSGGFIPALRDERTVVLTAALADRPSFGCGTESVATYFGRAWMIEGLNQTTDPLAAFDGALERIRERERAEGFDPSLPQRHVGDAIRNTLAAWQAQLQPGPPLPYPYAQDGTERLDAADTGANGLLRNNNGPRPADKMRGSRSGAARSDATRPGGARSDGTHSRGEPSDAPPEN